MDWQLLPESERFREVLESSNLRVTKSVLPEEACYGWIQQETLKRTWSSGLGPLAMVVRRLRRLIRRMYKKDSGRLQWEKAALKKMLPRNRFNVAVLDEKLAKQTFDTSTIAVQPWDLDYLENKLLANGLGVTEYRHTWGADGSYVPKPHYSPKPPKGQAGVGVLYDPNTKVVMTGTKQNLMSYARAKWWAMVEYVTKQGWSFPETADQFRSYSEALVKEFGVIYVCNYRTERGEEKVRALWIGDAGIWYGENAWVEPMKQDMKKANWTGYHPAHEARFAQSFLGFKAKFVTGDFAAMDLHCHWSHLRDAFKLWMRLYGVPEPIAALLAVVNIAAPYAIWDGSVTTPERHLRLQSRLGLNPSGGGMFSAIASLYTACLFLMHVRDVTDETGRRYMSTLALRAFALIFGDDHVLWLGPGLGLEAWIAGQKNFGQDAASCTAHTGEYKFLQRCRETTEGTVVPVILRLVRSMACPEDPAISLRSPYLTAVSLRAQLIPFNAMRISLGGYWTRIQRIVFEHLIEPSKGWKFSYMFDGKRYDYITPVDATMRIDSRGEELSDYDLATIVGLEHEQTQKLFSARRTWLGEEPAELE